MATASVDGSSWRHHMVITGWWGLFELEHVVLYLTLHDALPAQPLATFEPYSVKGEAMFRELLKMRAQYVDRVDAGEALPYAAFLLDDTFPDSVPTGSEGHLTARSNSTTLDLLADMEQLVAAIEDRDGSVTVAHTQAVALRESCRAAIALAADLRMRYVADLRPADAPIYEYTAAVEGFTSIVCASHQPESDSIIICLASGYVYRLTAASVRAADRIRSGMRIVDADVMFDGGVMRLTYDNGISADWTALRILALCEPNYREFDERLQGYGPNDKRWVRGDCVRLSPVLSGSKDGRTPPTGRRCES